MKQWYALYVFLYSYEFVTWPDCFVGHSCSGGNCPESGPLSLTCSISTMLGTLLTIDTWHMFSFVYFSVVVCLRGLYHHSVSLWQDPCVSFVHPPPFHAKTNPKRYEATCGSLVGVAWTDVRVCLHFADEIWDAGYFYFI